MHISHEKSNPGSLQIQPQILWLIEKINKTDYCSKAPPHLILFKALQSINDWWNSEGIAKDGSRKSDVTTAWPGHHDHTAWDSTEWAPLHSRPLGHLPWKPAAWVAGPERGREGTALSVQEPWILWVFLFWATEYQRNIHLLAGLDLVSQHVQTSVYNLKRPDRLSFEQKPQIYKACWFPKQVSQ